MFGIYVYVPAFIGVQLCFVNDFETEILHENIKCLDTNKIMNENLNNQMDPI